MKVTEEVGVHELLESRIKNMRDSGKKIVFACAGAGAGLQNIVWQIAGISKCLLWAELPYAIEKMRKRFGPSIQSAASLETAKLMAETLYREAAELKGVTPENIVAVGSTAAVQTTRERSGADLIHIAIRTCAGTFCASVTLRKNHGTRSWQGEICDLLTLNALLFGCGIEQIPLSEDWNLVSPQFGAIQHGEFTLNFERITPDWEREPVMITPDGQHHAVPDWGRPTHTDGADELTQEAVVSAVDGQNPVVSATDTRSTGKGGESPPILFPGAFDPVHIGHREMAKAATLQYGRPVTWVLSVHNARKGMLRQDEVEQRIDDITRRWDRTVVVSSKSPLFIDMVDQFGNGVGFLVGADTVLQILDPKYYNGPEGLETVLAQFQQRGVKFYVVDRVDGNGKLQRFTDIVPEHLKDLFLPIEGQWNVSSTQRRELRQAKEAPGAALADSLQQL